ncbi:hypothetical protein ElyMa_001999900 [Elysia marginata]|uniref:Uncharacterized protein n=1 Tax=Elysia marginata TaxID=1093978 RepID=A0AAV4F2R7_9GAST|nr:hypothetical protein ElyMa_001999900 [Elysia marginata]
MPPIRSQQDKENVMTPASPTEVFHDVQDHENSPRPQGHLVSNQFPEQQETARRNAPLLYTMNLDASPEHTVKIEPDSPPVIQSAVDSVPDSWNEPELNLTVSNLRGLESNMQIPFLFPSFTTTVNRCIREDSAFAFFMQQNGSARTSAFFAERYRIKKPLPPISIFLKPLARELGHSSSCTASIGHAAEEAPVAADMDTQRLDVDSVHPQGEGDSSEELSQRTPAIQSGQGETTSSHLLVSVSVLTEDTSARCRGNFMHPWKFPEQQETLRQNPPLYTINLDATPDHMVRNELDILL